MLSSAMRTQHPVISFLLFLALFEMAGGGIGWLTAQEVAGWYQTLNKSPLTPPDEMFGIVWAMLYALLAFAAWVAWRMPPHMADRGKILGLFAAHMIMNWAWNPLFFTGHAVGPSLILIFVLIFTAAMLGFLLWRVQRWAAAVFIPYIGWLIFAGHLTHFIFMNNPVVSNS